MDPYEILDLPPDATESEIKRAYRRAAARTHPDSENGDAEEFKEVEQAHAILVCPERRRRFDEFGDTEKKRAPTGFDIIAPKLGPAFSQDQHDPFEIIRQQVQQEMEQIQKNIRDTESAVAKFRAKVARIEGPEETVNLVRSSLEAFVREGEQVIETGREKVSVVEQALDLLKELKVRGLNPTAGFSPFGDNVRIRIVMG